MGQARCLPFDMQVKCRADMSDQEGIPMRKEKGGWVFEISESAFEGKFRIELALIPDVGQPIPLSSLS